MSLYQNGPFTIFDVETTGMSPVRDRIVEIAAVRIEKDGSLKHFSTLINPERHIPYTVSQVHHITDDMVKDAPFFRDIAQDFHNFIAGSRLIAHNARFDLSFLQESFFRSGFPIWDGRTIDFVKMIRNTHPGLKSYKLQELRKEFLLTDNPGMNPHRAAADVEWTRQLFEIVLTAMYNASVKK